MRHIATLLFIAFIVPFLFPTALPAQDEANVEKIVIKVSGGAKLGVRISDVTDDKDDEKNIDAVEGARVEGVEEGSPADKAGIRQGDVIVAFDGKEISDAGDLVKAVHKSEVGTKVDVTVMRDGKKQTLHAKLGKGEPRTIKRVYAKSLSMPGHPSSSAHPAMPALDGFIWHRKPVYGLKLKTLGTQLGEYFGAPEGKGVLIEEVFEDSKAEKAGFKAGDVIVYAGKKTVKKVSDFKQVLGAYDAGEVIPVRIIRKGSKRTINLTAVEQEEGHHEFKFFQNGNFSRAMDMYRRGMDCFGEKMKHVFKFKGPHGMMDLDDLEEMDIDIDVDVDDDGEEVRKIKIRVNGEEIVVDGFPEHMGPEDLEELEKHLKEHGKDVKVVKDGNKTIITIKEDEEK